MFGLLFDRLRPSFGVNDLLSWNPFDITVTSLDVEESTVHESAGGLYPRLGTFIAAVQCLRFRRLRTIYILGQCRQSCDLCEIEDPCT